VKVSCHFLDEEVCFDLVEIEDDEEISPIVNSCGKEEPFVEEVLLDLVEVIFELVLIVVVIILNFKRL